MDITNFVPRKINHGQKRKLDKLLLGLFSKDLQPFRVVEDVGFKAFVQELNPSYKMPDRKTISKSLVPAAYEECKANVISELKNVRHVTLTSDCWSSCAQDSFLALTAHFVTEDFRLESALLDCQVTEGSHTRFNLSRQIRNITDSFELSDKVVMIVTDNASNISNAVNERLQWPHFGCYAHTLNLIVTDALKHELVSNIIEKVKNLVSHFKRSNLDTEKLLKYQKDAGDQMPKKLVQEVKTRWNSTFYMLDRITNIQDAVKATVALLDKGIQTLTAEEWKICGELCKVLKPFEDVTKKLTGLTDVCQKLIKRPFHKNVQEVVQNLQIGILTRFNNLEMNKTIGTCSFLDPRYKLFAFSSSQAQNIIKEHVKKLATAEYNKERQMTTAPVNHERPSTSNSEVDEDAELSVTSFLKTVLQKAQPPGTATSSAIIEVQRYLEERTIDITEDPLSWWRVKQHAYPILAKLARKYLCMVASSVPCERVFSKTGDIVNEKRTRLKPSKVMQLIFLNANQKYVTKV